MIAKPVPLQTFAGEVVLKIGLVVLVGNPCGIILLSFFTVDDAVMKEGRGVGLANAGFRHLFQNAIPIEGTRKKKGLRSVFVFAKRKRPNSLEAAELSVCGVASNRPRTDQRVKDCVKEMIGPRPEGAVTDVAVVSILFVAVERTTVTEEEQIVRCDAGGLNSLVFLRALAVDEGFAEEQVEEVLRALLFKGLV